MAQPRLYIEVGADVKKAVQGLNNVERRLKGLGDQARAVRNIAIAVTGVVAIRQVVSGLYSLAKASQDEVASQVRLQRAIANTGRAIDTDLIRSIEDWVEVQERATGFADDQQRAALSFLVAQTGDLAEAQRRAALAADLAVGFDMDLVTASKMLGKVTDENIGSLRRLGIALPDAGAGYTDAMADADTAAELAHKAGISFEGAMKLVKSGGASGASVLKRYGVAMRQAAQGSELSADQVLGAVEKAVGGQARDRMKALGPGAQLTNDWNNLKEQIGGFLVPVFAKGAAVALKGIRGLRRAVSLFTTDLSGPRIGSARKIWKAVFGEEMPKALGIVVDWFAKIGTSIQTFVDDLNSEDPNKVRGAIKGFATALRDDAAEAVKKLGEQLDKLGPIGVAAKLALLGFGASIPLAPALDFASALAGIGAGLSIMVTNLAKVGVGFSVFTLAAGLIAILTVKLAETHGWTTAIGNALTGIGVGLTLLTGNPIFAVIGAFVQLGLTIGVIKDNWDKLRRAVHEGALDNKGVVEDFLITLVRWGDIFDALGTTTQQRLTEWGQLFSVFGTEVEGVWSGVARAIKGVWDNVWTHVDQMIFDLKAKLNELIRNINNVSPVKIPYLPGEPATGPVGSGPVNPWRPPRTAPPEEAPPARPPRDPDIIPSDGGGGRPTNPVFGGPRATLDDIYAAYERATGGTISFDYAKELFEKGFSYAQAAAGQIFMAHGGIVPPTPGGTLARIGEGGEAEMVLPLSKARDLGFGGGSLEVHVEVHGSVIGIGDLEQRVRAAVRDGVLSGGFRGVLAPAGGR